MPISFTSSSRKYQAIQPRGFIGYFTASVTGTTGSTRAMTVSPSDVGADSLDHIEFVEPLANGTTSALVPTYSATSTSVGTIYFWTGTNTGLIPVGSSTDLGTHSGLCRVYGTRA